MFAGGAGFRCDSTTASTGLFADWFGVTGASTRVFVGGAEFCCDSTTGLFIEWNGGGWTSMGVVGGADDSLFTPVFDFGEAICETGTLAS
jgi:hypothetical protein